jgi:hypothetical protein
LLFFNELKHIRAKLLTTQEESAITNDGKPLKAIMPSKQESLYGSTSSLNSNSFATQLESSELFNDFAIDITHVEKMVQDTDLIIMEKK